MSGEATLSRRSALKLLAGQMTLLVAGCSRPREEIVPYVRMPERLIPGVPLQFATTLELGGYGRGVLCTSVEGRPIKIEGNPLHPSSLGATDAFAEAAVLSLYDPDRSQTPRYAGEISDWPSFIDAVKPRLEALAASNGEGLRLLTGPVGSPTLSRQIGLLSRRFPALQWHVHDPLSNETARYGAVAAFGRPVLAIPRLADAEIVVSLDADPLGPGPMQIVNARSFATRRRAGTDGVDIGRLYAIEASPTLTGANADHRLVVPPAEIAALAIVIARQLGADLPKPDLPAEAAAFGDEVARDLAARRGRALVVAGATLPSDIHSLCHWINAQLQAPIDYIEARRRPAPARSLADLVLDLDAGKVEDLFVLGCNPAYDSPPGLHFIEAAAKAKFSVHFGGYFDETAAHCQWHLPATYSLEGWSDLEAPDGTASLVQPLIAPLYDTRSLHELIDVLDGGVASGYTLVRETWAGRAPPGDFETWWRRALNDGIIADTAAEKVSGLTPTLPQLKPFVAATPLALVLRPDPCIYDGSFANNAWLQELPKPLTKEVWGNSIGISPADAAALGVGDGDVVNLSASGGAVAAPVRISAGHAPGVLSLCLGHGRTAAGNVGTGIGANAYRLRADSSWLIEGIVAAPSGEHRPLPSTQHQFKLEGEAAELFPSYPLDQLHALESEKKVALASFLAEEPQSGARWGMVIDTSLCIGCNACVVACQVENNSPVVGPEEIARGRDMHWLRIDAYEIGSPAAPRIGFQPVPCMHCETAPCEPVCPTGASVHDHEGLNVQVYNRCIGTRFCEANCPYKVRRFNYFGYADGQEYADLGADVLRAHNNPDVTVRSRGVMEKCTYCVQRISRARRAADKEARPIADGDVVTACQAACPTQAISFGDLSLSEAKVSVQRHEPRHYSLLGHLDTKPRTTYLAQVRDFNPNLARRRG